MKVELHPEELWLIVDALDDKHQFQPQGGGRGGWGRGAVKARLRAIALVVFMISFNGMVVEPKFCGAAVVAFARIRYM